VVCFHTFGSSWNEVTGGSLYRHFRLSVPTYIITAVFVACLGGTVDAAGDSVRGSRDTAGALKLDKITIVSGNPCVRVQRMKRMPLTEPPAFSTATHAVVAG
jgi:hypothetical protein